MDNSNNKVRRNKSKYWNFLSAVFCTVLGLAFFLLGKYFVSGPTRYLLSSSSGEKLFSFNLSFQWQIGMALNAFFSAYNYLYKKSDESREKSEQLKFLVTKFLKLVVFSCYGIWHNWAAVHNSYFLMILVGAAYFASNCLLELLVELMNDYGVCNGFSLMFFADLLPIRWLGTSFYLLTGALSSWREFTKGAFLPPLLIALLTFCFIKFTNQRREVPVEINRLYFADNKLLNEDRSKFAIRMNFSFMNIIQISLLTKLLMGSYQAFYTADGSFSAFLVEALKVVTTAPTSPDPSSFKQSFLFLNSRNDFFREFWTFYKTANFLPALLAILVLSYGLNWLTILYTQIKPHDISEDLKKRGVYFDGVHPGTPTKAFIRKFANKLILTWTIFVLAANFLFDSILDGRLLASHQDRTRPSFFNWFNGVNTGIDLFRQVKTKYEYAKAYD